MGFLNVPKYFGYLINFQCQHPRKPSLNCHQSVLLDQAPLQLDREGIKAREDGERGGGGRLLEAGDYFKHFGLRLSLIHI